MGFFNSLVSGPIFHAEQIAQTDQEHPEQAALGINTPAETAAWNRTLGANTGTHYDPTINMYGGPTAQQYAKAQQQGVDMSANRVADAAAKAATSYYTMGLSTLADKAAQQYLINQGQDPNAVITNMASGGSVRHKSGLHHTAHYLKSKGRNDDTELVHMTKGEVQALKGLAAKHGGSLTTNPETGLPEAGFLGSILPMVAGVAAAAFAPELLPLIAGGIGVADYAATGSITKGLMAGLSAYGAGGIGEGLGEIGEAAAPVGDVTAESEANAANWGSADTTGKAVLQDVPKPSNFQNMVTGAGNVFSSAPAASSFAANNIGNIGMAASPLLMDSLGSNRSTVPTATTTNTNPYGLKTLSPNFQGTFPAQPNPAYQAHYPNYVQTPYNASTGTPATQSPGATIYAADGGLMQSGPDRTDFMGGGAYPMSQQTTPHYATPSQMPTSAQAAMASYEPNTNPLTGEPTGFAAGGIASYSGKYGSVVAMNEATQDLENLYGRRPVMSTPTPDVGIYQDTDPNTRSLSPYEAALYRINQKAKAAGMGKNAVSLPKPQVQLGQINTDNTPDTTDMASGGITSLGSYAAGGNPRLLKGPGDGMSDSIPANIGGKQPARLADGEFVVPADVVSHLGNGSTDAGAKKLYSMMDNIRRARTGRKKQAPAVKPDKYLPK